ncbi:MAG: hypothetical protein HQL26_03540, partial [Candidatus Omnitrophica bacterium]|nr:hypothetical protein [Candidatus Omnitrophota bacterium]
MMNYKNIFLRISLIASFLILLSSSPAITQAQDKSGNASGAKLTDTQLKALSDTTATPIVYGQTVTSSIATPSTINKYSFVANAGDVIYLAIRDTTLKPNFEIQARIYDTAGNQIVQNWYSDTGTLAAKLPTT